MPDSATRTTPAGILRRHAHGPVGVDLERDQVALVHADQRRRPPRAPARARPRRGSRPARRARARRPAHGSRASSVSSSAATISSTASAPMSRASTTSWAETVKSLRSTGSATAPRAAEIGGRAAEELDVGEHRQARGAAHLVLAGQRGRIEVGDQVALRRRPPLDLGDHRHQVGPGRRLRGLGSHAAKPRVGRAALGTPRSDGRANESRRGRVRRCASRMRSRYVATDGTNLAGGRADSSA